MSSMTPSEVKDITTIIKRRMNDANIDPQVIKFLLSTYDLHSFVSTYNLSFSELVAHFIGHARAVENAVQNWDGK